ncbi:MULTISPECIES: hypothetical protein [Cyanophyceae]|uniref:CopG-like ribbon-helix-helix domain-containing protein n=1 Tax=Stenomitos frigidus AS-A4 TaxID=2933935 RepID=A0ABV0KRK8_9CYAN|nr:hypothetical protein [Phormidium sp. FACHB-592]
MISESQILSFDEMAPTKKEKVTFTCTAETKQALEVWAEKEGRTISNLVERIVLSALAVTAEEQKQHQ